MAKTFEAAIRKWVEKVEGAAEAIFLASVQELVDNADALLVDLVYNAPPSPNYKRTGFLRSSLVVSKVAMPLANRPQNAPDADYMAEIQVTIGSAEVGETIYIGWTANYAPFVHYGANGAAPKPWVTLAAQRWQEIVDKNTAELRSRLR